MLNRMSVTTAMLNYSEHAESFRIKLGIKSDAHVLGPVGVEEEEAAR